MKKEDNEIVIDEPTLEQFENAVKKVLLSDNFRKTDYENKKPSKEEVNTKFKLRGE